MGKVERFEDLFVWRTVVDFAKEIYVLTERHGIKTDFGLKNQMRAAALSISSNIAEGFERRSRKEYLNFLNIAKGSAGEIRSQLCVAFEVGYIEEAEYRSLVEKAKFLSGSLSNHMFAVSKSVPRA